MAYKIGDECIGCGACVEKAFSPSGPCGGQD